MKETEGEERTWKPTSLPKILVDWRVASVNYQLQRVELVTCNFDLDDEEEWTEVELILRQIVKMN